EPALSIRRQHLQDDDPSNRIRAARGVWRINKDKKAISVLTDLMYESRDKRIWPYQRADALRECAEIGREVPELFPVVVNFATHDDESLRAACVAAMRHFGDKGLPTILKGLEDSSESVRWTAANTCRIMGPHARFAVPALERLVEQPN